MKLYLISIATVAVALQVQAATPRIITVPQDYPTIAAAIAAANSGDTINVNPGTYNKGSQSWSFGDKLIALRSVAGPTVTKLDIHGGSALGIKGKSEISGFTISNSQPHYGESIHVTGDGTLIRGNIFENNHGSTGGLGAAIVGF